MDSNQKTQVVERLRQAQNILIAVSSNPSVDQLASAIGLALLMTKLGKHTTAVFSGTIPSTLEFLKPETTLEKTTDSLRDFIISLDKSKADKLRYKVEEKVVKVFVTPYRTSLNQSDFTFEQGDYNVDVVIALGVDKKEHIDQAITAHGRILHNATVLGLMAGKATTDIGSINWVEASASSLCEMIVSISESFQSGLLDNQIATAFLTGIVANTERFSNNKTTPKVMTMAAQLMAAGANQQLISDKLAIVKETPQEASIDLQKPVASQPKPAVSTPKTVSSTPKLKTKPTTPPKVVEKKVTPTVQLPPAPSGESSEAAPNEIKIDDQGTLYHVSELLDQDQAPSGDKPILDKGPDVKPPEEPANYSGYMKEPPEMSGTLTANAKPEDDGQTIDPFNTVPNAASQPKPSENIEDTLMSGQEETAPTDGDDQTLVEKNMAKLEKSVQAGQQAPDEQADQLDADAARQMVNQAAQPASSQPKPAVPTTSETKPLTPGPNLSDKDGQPPAVPPPILSPAYPPEINNDPVTKKDNVSPPDMPTPTQ